MKNTRNCDLCSVTEIKKEILWKRENFLKKYLKFSDGCVIIYRLTSDATKREVAIAPCFPRRIWGISAEQVRLEAGRRMRETKAVLGNCAGLLRKPLLRMGALYGCNCPILFSPSVKHPAVC